MISRLTLRTALLLASTALPAMAHAQELPAGGTVAAGSATIGTPGNGSLAITQSSDRAIINWQSFSVGQGGTVNIVQPSSTSALLNRVTSDATSVIAGQINANGQVYLVNPNGILITKTGSVNAAGFTASTLDIGDDDFMSGSTSFTVTASRPATVIALRSGLSDLLASTLSDHALIYGRIEDVEGTDQRMLDLTGDGFLRLGLPAGGITVAGTINAHEVVLTAGTARDAARGVVNLSGTINATSASEQGGIIRLTGESVNLTGATIDASGAIGGGLIEIGGGPQGTGDLAHATSLTVDATSIIRADATQVGNGGSVTLWSDGSTQFAGTISATGGAQSGNGGWVETSGHTANLNGARIDTSAAHGAAGTWLIDPVDFTVAASGGDITGHALTSNLALGNVTIKSSDGASGAAGNINVNDAVSWNANTLTLDAYADINVNALMNATGTAGFAAIVGDTAQDGTGSTSGALNFGLGSTSFYGTLNLAATSSFSLNGIAYTIITSLGAEGSTTGTDLQGMNGDLTGNYVLGADIDASGTASWNSGAGFTPVGNVSNRFTGTFDGLGHVVSGLTINRPTTSMVGLFGYANSSSIGNVGLLDATIGGDVYAGALVGLFDKNGGLISNSFATGSVSGSEAIGGLAGYNYGTISNSHSAASVSASGNYAGGLAGNNDTEGRIIENSYATGSVTGDAIVGGLAGSSSGMISDSYATGAVSGTSNVGGLVGRTYSSATITNSYATGSVTGDSIVGGLIGYKSGAISDSYATGAVSGTASVGGLVGFLVSGTVSGSYWDSYSTGQSSAYGDNYSGTATITEVTSDPTQSGAANYAFSQSAYADLDFTSDWFMVDGSTRPFLRSEYSTVITNSHQLQLMAVNLTASYTLANDIDLAETGAVVSGTPSSYAGMWAGTGFSPIGRSSSDRFKGSFDGLDHVISNLTINRPSANYVGLFGYTSGGSISNVGLEDIAIKGNQYTGGLIGYKNGTKVSGVYTSGSVSGKDMTGGLVGFNSGAISFSHSSSTVTSDAAGGGLVGYVGGGKISDSYATGNVSSADNNIGGLVGLLSAGTVTHSYATGTVSGANYVGGLVGVNRATITYSYATGKASGAYNVGGLVGIVNGGTISGSYATGSPSGFSGIGGLVGSLSSGTVSSSYWDSYSSGQSSGIGSQTGGTASVSEVTSDPVQSGASNYAFNPSAWADFNILGTSDIDTVGGVDATWRMYSGNTYPLLKSFLTTLAVDTTAASDSSRYTGYAQSFSNAYSLPTGTDLSLVFGSLSGSATDAGSYDIGIDGLYSTQQGYDLVAGSTGVFNVLQARLLITGGTSSATYDATGHSNSFSVSGLLGSDSVDSVTGLASGTNAGSYADNLTGATGTGISNYSIKYENGSLTIDPAALTITGATTSLTYDALAHSNSFSVSGLLGSDSVDSVAGLASGTNVGSYADSLSGATGTGLSNYTISYVDGSLTIDPAVLTITGATTSLTYDALAHSNSFSVSGLLGSDSVDSVAGLASGTNAGSYSDNLTGATGTGLSNYTISYVDGSLTIDPAPGVGGADAGTQYGSGRFSGSLGIGTRQDVLIQQNTWLNFAKVLQTINDASNFCLDETRKSEKGCQ